MYYYFCALMFIIISFKSTSAAKLAPASFVFGDSLVDVGNNNHLPFTIAKADFPHNGIDFPSHKPTGRFSNGKNAADFLAEKLGLLTSPPYLSLKHTKSSNFSAGVSFASGGAGIFDGTDQLNMFEFVRANYFSAFLVKSPNEMVEDFVENMILYAGDWAARHHPFLQEEAFIVLLCVAHLPETPKYAPLVHKYHDVLHSNYTYNLEKHCHEGVWLGTLWNFKTDLHYLELGGNQREIEIIDVHIPEEEGSDHNESEGSNISTARSISPEYYTDSPIYISSSPSSSDMSEDESQEPEYYYPGLIDPDDSDYDPSEDMDETEDN